MFLKSDGITNVIVPTNTVDVSYDTRVSDIIDWDFPSNITQGIWDVYIEFEYPVTGVGVDKFF